MESRQSRSLISLIALSAMMIGTCACGRSDEPLPESDALQQQPPVPGTSSRKQLPLEGRAELRKDAAGWQTVTDRVGGFSASFPSAPRLEEEKMGSAPDALMYLMTIETPNSKFTVSYSDRPGNVPPPKNIDDFLKEAAARSANLVRGVVTSNQPVKMGENPGRTLEADLPPKGLYRSRFYLVGSRLYQLVAMTENTDSSGKDLDKFLSSFSLSQTK